MLEGLGLEPAGNMSNHELSSPFFGYTFTHRFIESNHRSLTI